MLYDLVQGGQMRKKKKNKRKKENGWGSVWLQGLWSA